MEKGAADRIPLIDGAGGRTESTDGSVFPYAFPLLLNYYGQASVGINYIAEREGGFDKLKGKRSSPSTTTQRMAGKPKRR